MVCWMCNKATAAHTPAVWLFPKEGLNGIHRVRSASHRRASETSNGFPNAMRPTTAILPRDNHATIDAGDADFHPRTVASATTQQTSTTDTGQCGPGSHR